MIYLNKQFLLTLKKKTQSFQNFFLFENSVILSWSDMVSEVGKERAGGAL